MNKYMFDYMCVVVVVNYEAAGYWQKVPEKAGFN